MHKVERSVLLPYSAAQMFDLVTKVEDYPSFLPWCSGSQVHMRDDSGLEATIQVSLAGMEQQFRTRNTHHYPTKMEMRLIEGPFSAFDGVWNFLPLDETACKVTFDLNYGFSNKMLDMVVGPIFNKLVSGLIDSFTQRAEVVYGQK